VLPLCSSMLGHHSQDAVADQSHRMVAQGKVTACSPFGSGCPGCLAAHSLLWKSNASSTPAARLDATKSGNFSAAPFNTCRGVQPHRQGGRAHAIN
jgi:hypothetical protein